jgi:peptide/nickel transport system permease protein
MTTEGQSMKRDAISLQETSRKAQESADAAILSRQNRSLTRDAFNRMVSSPSGVVGLAAVLALILIALTAHWIAPYPPLETDPPSSLLPPSWEHWMGTDEFGRDVFSRVLHGARISMQVGLIATLVSVALGTTLGLLSGYAGGLTDSLVMRLTDIFIAIPAQLLSVAILAALGPSLGNVMLAVGVVGVPRFTRLVRATVLSAKQNQYCEAARVIGCSGMRVAMRHILPNVVGPAVILATIYVSAAILLAAGLSFLGMGAQPPTPEWGAMMSKGRRYLRAAPWVTSFPGLAIMVTVLAINLLGDALRDALDPKMTR